MSPKRIGNGVKSSKGGNSIYAYPAGGWVEAGPGPRAHVLRCRMCAGNKDIGGFYSGGFIPLYLICIGGTEQMSSSILSGGFGLGGYLSTELLNMLGSYPLHSSLFFSFAHIQSINVAILITK